MPLADNKLALNAGWDEELLALELKSLVEIDLDFDIGITGFSVAEIDGLIEGLSPEEAGDPEDDRLPELQQANVVSRPGDIWELGPHRVLCGNSLERKSYERLLGPERAQMVFTDPPYNLPIAGHVGGVTLAMEQDEPADPDDIRLLGPWPQMPRADRDPNTVEEPRRREVRSALFRDTREGFELSEATLEHARAATIAPIHIRVEIAWPSQTRMCAPRSRSPRSRR